MKEIIAVISLALGMILIVGLIMSYPVMLLWNGCFVGAVSGVNEITWLQAWGLVMLFGMLFKSSVTKK